jgi:hypothetical protein
MKISNNEETAMAAINGNNGGKHQCRNNNNG